ncbi:MAG: GTP 3',8-cyclase MoaA [Kiritimatiellia bacterium]|jgi:cyclic pyranopterin phosphate synthase|nr:GTP 3',8-cyclase MoaA [Kiritimatiellia bacterium]
MIATKDSNGLYLRVSVTDRCQLRCSYCMPKEGIEQCSHKDILNYEEIVSFVRAVQQHYHLRKVRITGGDPLVRPNIETLIAMLSDAGIPDIAITTNGQLLTRRARQLKNSGLHRVSVSLDSLCELTFRDLNGGSLEKTLEGIESAIRLGLTPLKLNMVVLRGINDAEVGDIADFALARGCEVRFLELMPIGYGASRFEDWYVSSEEVRRRLSQSYTLSPLPVNRGETSCTYSIEGNRGRSGTVGFISPYSHPFCDGCRRLRLTADGNLLGCLASEKGVSVRNILRSDDPAAANQIGAIVAGALKGKPTCRTFKRRDSMAAIGG